MFQATTQCWGDVFRACRQCNTLPAVQFCAWTVHALLSSLFLHILLLSTVSLVEEKKPDTADMQPPSCPGANNTVWNTNGPHSFVIYCDSIFQGSQFLFGSLNTSISECFLACGELHASPGSRQRRRLYCIFLDDFGQWAYRLRRYLPCPRSKAGGIHQRDESLTDRLRARRRSNLPTRLRVRGSFSRFNSGTY